MRLRPLVPLALLAVLPLTACGDDDGSGASAGTEKEARTAIEQLVHENKPREACREEPVEGPGTYACLGVPATVTFASRSTPDEQGTGTITLLGAEVAPDAVREQAIADHGLEEQAEGADLWFFRFRAAILEENRPGALDGFAPYDFADGSPWSEESSAESTMTFGDLEGCPEETFETDVDADEQPVTEIEYCHWWFVDEGDEIHGMAYNPIVLDDYEPLRGRPVYLSLSPTAADSYVVED